MPMLARRSGQRFAAEKPLMPDKTIADYKFRRLEMDDGSLQFGLYVDGVLDSIHPCYSAMRDRFAQLFEERLGGIPVDYCTRTDKGEVGR